MSLKINRSSIVIVVALLVYLKPANVVLWPQINMIYKIVKVFITLIILVVFIKRKMKFDKSVALCLLFITVWGTSIYFNNGQLGSKLQELLSIIGMLFLFKWIEYSDRKITSTLSIIDKIAKIYFVLELITVILDKPLFAEAKIAYDKYFLGSDNYSAFILIPLAGIMFSYSQIKYKKITIGTWIFSFIAFLDLLIPFAVMGMISYLLMIFLFIFVSNPEIRRFFSIKRVVVMAIIFLIAVIGFNIQNHLSGLLAAFGKTGLNSREIIWPKAIQAFFQRPWVGWGSLSEKQVKSYLLYGANHAHNIFLEIILDSGLIGMAIMIAWIKEIYKGLNNCKVKYSYLLQICFACYILCGIFDFYLSSIYFWMLIFSIEIIKKYHKIVNRDPKDVVETVNNFYIGSIREI